MGINYDDRKIKSEENFNQSKLSKQFLKDFQTVIFSFNNSLLGINEQMKNEIINNYNNLITLILDYNSVDFDLEIFNNYIDALKNLLTNLDMIYDYKKHLDILNKNITNDIFLDTQDENDENINNKNIVSSFDEKLNLVVNETFKKNNVYELNEYYKYLKNIIFIIEHPEDPIPDEQDDDEINVFGGKISLKDPISLSFFTNPVYSINCKHTFEKNNILKYLESSKKCPINGCNAFLNTTDLKSDILMKIRTKVFMNIQKNLKINNN